jgi:adenylate kinase
MCWRKVLIVGRPGAGKGTQGARLARRLNVQHVSTGDLLRHEIEVASPFGRAVERLVNAGRLVPTGLIMAIVETNLHDDGYVLDGFPRTIAQAEGLFDHTSLRPGLTVHLDVSEAVIRQRLHTRGRRDDGAAATAARLEAYERDMVPTLAALQQRCALCKIDGAMTTAAVEREVWNAVLGAALATDPARTGIESPSRPIETSPIATGHLRGERHRVRFAHPLSPSGSS